MADRLKGKVAVITGAASGIGAETARLFASEGANVVIADMQAEKGQAVAKELGDQGVFCQVDVRIEEDIASMIDLAMTKWGRVDILYNNAGFGGALGPIETTTMEDYDLTFDVLVKSVFLGIKHVTPIMKAQNSGNIISTASVAGLMNGVSPHLYGVCKAAVIKLTETVSLELGEHNIRVNAICPGLVATPLTVGKLNATDEDVENLRKSAGGNQPLGRAGVPDDIAQAALFLASEASSYITGHALVVDGGIRSGPTWSQWPEYMRKPLPLRLYRPEGA
ncbi:MAG: glucose 1-dehydrogenase [Alphaproteobacteria bacterium]|nr:MAG: glucose 1-dehydrogenase [Alphaproteobacteria bacterium]